MNQQIKTIRIFISSTFKDMHSERDYLVKYVFPELRDRCIKKGLSLVDVDLRWGVTEEEAEQGKAIEICLDEIENCRPFFIRILGERYGWTPTTYQVPDYEKYDWLRKFEKGHSITALEIYHGVLNKKKMKPRAFFYFRNPAFIGDVPLSKQAEVKAESDTAAKKLYHLKEDIKDVFELNNIPEHIMPAYPCKFKGLKMNLQLVKDSLSAELTKQDVSLLETLVGEDNLIDKSEYESLNEKQKTIVDKYSYVYLEELEEFGNEVLKNIWEAICDEHPDDNIVTDPLLIEQAYHQRFMNSRSRGFIGREDVLGEIADYINDASKHKPLIVKGEPGSGKSALMAIAAKQNENKTDAGFTIVRFVGASPASLDINKLVQNIIRETASIFEITIDEERINDVKVLYDYFREVLYSASTKGKLTLFIDALNQLLPQYDPHYLVWLPKHLPENVKMVLSSIESEYIKNALKYELPLVQVGELTTENSRKIIQDTLEEYRKTLTEKQIATILSRADAVKPLYLKVACEELRVFPSFELINSRIAALPETIAGLFEQFLQRLEADHDPQLVKDTLCLIESSMYGLLESELLELLKPEDNEKLPLNIWAKLYRNLSPYLMNAGDESEGLLEFFHLQLSLAAQKRYLKNDEIFYNKKLADYGLQKYKLKNRDTTNTILYTGIYLYKSLDEDALYDMLQNLFTAKKEIYTEYKGIAANLFDWVVNNFDYESEITLKSITGKLAKNDFSYQLRYLLQNKGNILKNIGKMRWAQEFLEKSLHVMEELVALEPGRTDFKRELSVLFGNVGVIYKSLGEEQKTLEFFEKSLKVMEELVALEPGRTDFRRDLSVSFNNVGQIYLDLGEAQKALEFFEKQKNTLEELVALEPGRTDFRRELSVSFNNVGEIYQDLQEGQKALEFFEKALKEMEELVALEPGRMDFRRSLSVSYNNVGQIYQDMGERKKALEFSKKFLKEMEELVALEPGRMDFRRDLSVSFNNVGQIHKSMGEGQKALEFFEKDLKVMEELVALEPCRTDFRRDFSASINNVGQIYQDMGEGQKALEFFEKDLKVMEELVALEPGRTDYKRDLAASFNNVGQIYQDMGEGQKALEFFEKDLKVLEELVAHEPGRTDFKRDLSVSFLNMAQIYMFMGGEQKALEFFEKDLKVKEELIALEPDSTDFRRDLSVSYNNVGQIYQAMGGEQKALDFFEKDLKVREELVALEPGRTDFRRDLSVSFNNVGQIYQAMGVKQKALVFFEKDLKVMKELVALEPGRTDFRRDLSMSFNNVGQIYQAMGVKQKALVFFEKDLKVMEELVALEPGSADFRRDLSVSFNNIGQIYQAMGEGQKALEFFENALKGMEVLLALEPGRTDFRRDLSASYNNVGQIYKSMGEGQKALEFSEKFVKVIKELVALEPGRTDFRRDLSVSYNNAGKIYKSMGEGQKALAFFEKQKNSLEELVALEPGRTDFRMDYAVSHWNIYQVCSKDDKLSWLNKTKDILEPMVIRGVAHAQLKQLWDYVNKALSRYNSVNSTEVSEDDKNIEKRSQALAYYQSGNYKDARKLLEELLNVNFEAISIRIHLARLALITDDLEEAAQQTLEVWELRKEAKSYVIARILWFKLCLEFLNTTTKQNKGVFGKIKSLYKKEVMNETSIILSQLKTVLQKDDAFMNWTMQPVLDHIKPQITEQQHTLLSALVTAMSNKINMEKLNEFEEWRDAKPEEIE
jgi:tetratricopeptide (TPR) repeat protein